MMDNLKYDVAIIGGGLAGLTLSIQCATAGYKTVLFEKEQYPFHKVCGEYISMESWNFLKNIGLNLQQFDLPQINKLQLSDVKGKLYEFDLPLGGFGISRFVIDNYLYEIAKSSGVDIYTHTKVNDVLFENDSFTLQTNNGLFFSTIAAGAFGKRSNIDVKWKRGFTLEKADKLNNFIGVKYHIQYPLQKNLITLHNFYNGYCGISNIEEEKCCLCYLTTAKNLQLNDNSIHTMEQNILCKNPRLKEIFSDASFLYAEPLTISQISFHKKKQVENNMLMMGDAAGMITPLCGNGMSMAMHAGKIAFSNIHLFLQGKTSRKQLEQSYTSQWQQLFQRRLWMGRTVQRFFGNNTSTIFFLKTMDAMPWIAKQIISATHGDEF